MNQFEPNVPIMIMIPQSLLDKIRVVIGEDDLDEVIQEAIEQWVANWAPPKDII